jgi:hypothetical protein
MDFADLLEAAGLEAGAAPGARAAASAAVIQQPVAEVRRRTESSG